MFEDQNKSAEVADIFAGVDKTLETAAPAPADSVPAPEPSFAPPPAKHRAAMIALILGGIVLILVIVILVMFKFGLIYRVEGEMEVFPTVGEAPTEEETKAPAEKTVPASPSLGGPAEAAPDKAVEPVVEVDSDSDGLTDALEKALGTNILKLDTDGDLLSDFDEVKIYETDPLNMDTDGDGYKDGEEVSKGYNPKGPGKLLNFDEAINNVK